MATVALLGFAPPHWPEAVRHALAVAAAVLGVSGGASRSLG
jgi:hypothetical protein